MPENVIEAAKRELIQAEYVPPTESRLTIISNVTYQTPGEQPSSAQAAFDVAFSSDEDEFRRRLKLQTEWKSLKEFGPFFPVGDCAAVMIYNKVGVGRTVEPTAEEKLFQRSQNIEISFDGTTTHITLPPRGQTTLFVVNPEALRLRASAGVVPVTLTMFAK